MATPTEIVQQFCAAFAAKDAATIATLLADDVVYHNVGMEPAVGKEASLAAIQGFLDMSESLVFDIHRIAAAGDVVLTERTDTFTINGAKSPIPVMGAFDLRDGLIVAWRDYFDMGLTTRMMGGETVEPSLLPTI
ncbi:MAG TPA: limonene-1,2-epoxide hydrolase family protein [Acidimicrobiia bacterium]|jgi:limonene-1,2-epoxide hydrolase|nr:limonene-1,2-epoxide hydrolase family protein [Acidimicrobiia bacterium]